ncbi:MAG: hypothetical protein BWK80_29850 [Desulfobacteraceae bacterium IS3]|nr:MAG: hypothetical protein BWK80_29850 [Desulfobacteraceae bacterium IS3]HAO22979.1 hypothetical protein [Desulfobacteraceae bacterium]
MAEINYKDLESHLKAKKFSPVYLIHGEEFLYKTAFESVLNSLLAPSDRDLNYEAVENENIFEAIERLNTFSMMSGTKVVSLCDSRIFYSKQDDEELLQKAKDAFDAKELKKAGKYLSGLLGLLKLSYDDLSPENRDKYFKLDLGGDDKWLDALVAFCKDNDIKIIAPKNNAEDLQQAIEKGFPTGHYLLITTDIADKRRGLFKAISEKGIAIDCSVPKGERKADKIAQESVLQERMKSVLSESGKMLEPAAYHALYEMTGFDLRTFSSNLEKLVSYVGDRKKITLQDVESVLKRTRLDPIYELTNAVADRNAQDSLFFMTSLLSAGFFPLQILAAIANQIRRLLLIKGFAESPQGKKVWKAGLSYNPFQEKVMPAIQDYDKALTDYLESNGNGDKKKKSATELLIAKNPKSPYPIYQVLLKSEKFGKHDLVNALEALSSADMKLKTGGGSPKLILEELILRICYKNLYHKTR